MRSSLPLRIPGNRSVQGDTLIIGGDVVLVRSAPNTLALRNGTNPQALHINGTWADGSNMRRLRLGMDAAGVATISAEGLGTGLTGNSLQLLVDGVNAITYSAAGVLSTAVSFQIASGSSLRFGSTRSRLLSPADGTVNMTTAAGAALTSLQFGGVQVLTTRRTGWALPTGTLTRTSFDPSTVTLAGVAERLAALITDLHGTGGHGVIGT